MPRLNISKEGISFLTALGSINCFEINKSELNGDKFARDKKTWKTEQQYCKSILHHCFTVDNTIACSAPAVLSSVSVHSVHQLIVQRYQVADQPGGAQAWTLASGQEVLKVAVQIQILTAEFLWDFQLICV